MRAAIHLIILGLWGFSGIGIWIGFRIGSPWLDISILAWLIFSVLIWWIEFGRPTLKAYKGQKARRAPKGGEDNWGKPNRKS